VPDAIAEAAIGQLRFDVSTNAEGMRGLDEQMTNLNQYVYNELEANSRRSVTKEGEEGEIAEIKQQIVILEQRIEESQRGS
jgi:hypothetical protein